MQHLSSTHFKTLHLKPVSITCYMEEVIGKTSSVMRVQYRINPNILTMLDICLRDGLIFYCGRMETKSMLTEIPVNLLVDLHGMYSKAGHTERTAGEHLQILILVTGTLKS